MVLLHGGIAFPPALLRRVMGLMWINPRLCRLIQISTPSGPASGEISPEVL
jgi:hypothetical protein